MLKNKHGWTLQHHELYPLLGIGAGHKLPAEGFGPVTVQGVTFKCLPVDEKKPGVKFRHRVFYICVPCNKWVPFGRADQHNKGRHHKDNAINTSVLA